MKEDVGDKDEVMGDDQEKHSKLNKAVMQI